MTCQELERILYPYLDGEFQPEERLEVETHLAHCGACARRVHGEAQVQQALRRAARHAVETTRAPDRLRAGLHAGLAREARHSAQNWVLMRAGAAAVVVAVAGSAWFALRPLANERLLEAAARRHARPQPIEIAHSSPEDIEEWFRNKLDHRVVVPRLPDATVTGARLSHVSDHPAAYITYEAAATGREGRPRRIGLFVFGDTERLVEAAAWPAVQLRASHGYNVALWRDGEIVYEMVTEMGEADIRHMLARLAEPPAAPGRVPERLVDSAPVRVPPTPAQQLPILRVDY